MKHINKAERVPSPSPADGGKDKTVTQLLDDAQCRVVAVELRNGEQLSRHHAAEPISVLCLSGDGVFTAGPDLSDRTELTTGSLITLAAGVEHEVTATPEMRILVTKYKHA
jgi:quercetin dioxygenase-like cupin family protein